MPRRRLSEEARDKFSREKLRGVERCDTIGGKLMRERIVGFVERLVVPFLIRRERIQTFHISLLAHFFSGLLRSNPSTFFFCKSGTLLLNHWGYRAGPEISGPGAKVKFWAPLLYFFIPIYDDEK
jgi:hypothetical protein